jgi:hypothetical protein
MERITFEEYQKAAEIVNRYKAQCENDLLQLESQSICTDLRKVQIGQIVQVVKDVRPARLLKKGDTFRVLDKHPRLGIAIRNKQGNLYWISFSNTYKRWGF